MSGGGRVRLAPEGERGDEAGGKGERMTDLSGGQDQPTPATDVPAATEPTDPPNEMRGSSKKWWFAGFGAALVALSAVGITVYFMLARANSDEAKIEQLVEDFAAAVDRQDQAAIIALLCAQEAGDIIEDDDYNPANDGGMVEPPGDIAVDVSDIAVTDATASASVSRPGQPTVTLHFRIEDGSWKVCAPAGDQDFGAV